MTSNDLTFKANVGIKDIIGRGLILDDNIAVIELIKNSKDAESSKVKIHFSNHENHSDASELVLTDFGHGMSLKDIKEKWLNIAYSEKKAQKKQGSKAYAGNKGVGRFSCDRLGKELILYTKSKEGDYIKLPIDWTLFETNKQEAEISSVHLEYEILSKEAFLEEINERSFETGTVLKITKLRSIWGQKKLKKLVSELEKFVSAPDSEFQVYLTVNDGKEVQIRNNVFNELEFRTYYIKSSIDELGEYINTALYYHGEVIYEYVASNPYKHLKNIALTIHFLNFTAKSYFRKRTGYSSNEYGSIFLFLNGFRVSPYGNKKNDWLGLDQRKSQGTSRYLGTRELLGKINIEDYDDIFAPVTSREGIVHNEAYHELTAHDADQKITLKNDKLGYGYITNIVRQLERFIVGGINWHSLFDIENPDSPKVISESDIRKDPTKYAIKPVEAKLLEDVIEKLLHSSSFSIKTFKINKPLIKRLSKEAEDAYNEYILSFIENTTGKNFQDLSPKDKGDLRKIAEDNMRNLQEKKEAEKKAAEATKKAKAAEDRANRAEKKAKTAEKKAKAAEKSASEAHEKLHDVQSENLFLRSDANKESEDLLNLHHQIVLYCATAESEIDNLKSYLLDQESVSAKEVLELITSIEDDISKISKVSRFATHQKYKLAIDSINGNLIKFINDYINELNTNNLLSRKMKVVNELDHSITFNTSFSPMDIMVLIDNFISNTRRASGRSNTKEITFSKPFSKEGLFTVKDKGPGLAASIETPSRIFEKGFTTTEGSGRGLFHVKETLKGLGLGIRVIEQKQPAKGLCLEVYKNAN